MHLPTAAMPASPTRATSLTRSTSTTRAASTGAASEQAWLTAVLRPAGSLDQAAVARLGTAVGYLAAASDMVLVDLTAADVRSPRTLALALREPAAAFERAGRCLLLAGASPALTAELDRAAVPVATLGTDVLPLQAPAQIPAQAPVQAGARHLTGAAPLAVLAEAIARGPGGGVVARAVAPGRPGRGRLPGVAAVSG